MVWKALARYNLIYFLISIYNYIFITYDRSFCGVHSPPGRQHEILQREMRTR